MTPSSAGRRALAGKLSRLDKATRPRRVLLPLLTEPSATMSDAGAHPFSAAIPVVRRWWSTVPAPQGRPASYSKVQASLDSVKTATPVAFLEGDFDIYAKVDKKLQGLQPTADAVKRLEAELKSVLDTVTARELQVSTRKDGGRGPVKSLNQMKTPSGKNPAASTSSPPESECSDFMKEFFDTVIYRCYGLLHQENPPKRLLYRTGNADFQWVQGQEYFSFVEMKACQSENSGDHLVGLHNWLKRESKDTGSNLYDLCNRRPALNTKDMRINPHCAKLFQALRYLSLTTREAGLSSTGLPANLIWTKHEVEDGGTLYRWELYELPRKPEELTDEDVLKFIKLMVYIYDQYGGGPNVFDAIPPPTQDDLKQAAAMISLSKATPPGVLWVQWLRSFIPGTFTFLPSTPTALGASIVCQKPPSYSMPTLVWTDHTWCLRVTRSFRFWVSSYMYIPLYISHYSRQATILRGPGESFVVKVFIDADSFDREVECLRRLDGLRGVPSLFACGSVPGLGPFTITSYVGEPVSDLSPLEARSVNESIVKPMHVRGVHHHDLVQGNITRDKDGEFHIVDFGEGTVVQEEGVCGGECRDQDWAEILWCIESPIC
ncbi:hypothetical protein DFP72DRAFT_904316 [Ephemerocybe angulata]|uniref:Protein kinase domain-containing protein n=1 Tax=Ephemerocybe angulata TaxID=980116 RepID=A0A8H6M4B4_9AGAR|nr:hypothetical protein DFP72DRAFT_904316 [Tulosesus angulatus]